MSDNSKRPWFRFHLLTLVLMALAASVLLWANMRQQGLVHGWPFTMHSVWISLDSEEAAMTAGHPYWEWDGVWNLRGVILNSVAALASLTIVAALSEAILRRREARKT